MSTATVFSRARNGINAPEIKIEVHISNGLPAFQIVGLPDASVRESKDRVRSALVNSNFQFPQTRIRIPRHTSESNSTQSKILQTQIEIYQYKSQHENDMKRLL